MEAEVKFLKSSKAIKLALKGGLIRRKGWDKEEFLVFVNVSDVVIKNTKHVLNGFLAKYSEDYLHAYTLTTDDLLSHDWEIVV